MQLKYTISLLIITLFIPVLSGQSGPNPEAERGGTITGRVMDQSSKQPMEYTSVAIYQLNDSTLVTGTVSGPSGDFRITGVPYGAYYMEIKFVGYEKSVVSPITLSPQLRVARLGDIILEVSRNAIDEVQVVAEQRRVEYRIDKKVVNVSEDLNAAGGTAVDVLENTPSVTVDIEGNVSLRGSSNFTVLINGKPTVLDAADALRQIPASNIQNIEIITNPSVKYDPDGNAGILNVVLKKQIEKGTTGIVNASIGRNDKYRIDALINRRIGNMTYFVGGGYNYNFYPGTLIRENTNFLEDGTEEYNFAEGDFDFQRGGGQLKAGINYDLTPKSNISFEVNGGNYTFGIDRSNISHEFTSPATDDLYFLNTDVMERDGMYYSGNFSFTQTFDTSAHKIVVMANYSRRANGGIEEQQFQEITAEGQPILTSDLFNRVRNVETGDDNEYRFQVDYTLPTRGGKFEAGYQARIDNDLENFYFEEYDPDTDVWSLMVENASDISFFRNIQSVYAQYGGSINKLQYQLGLRGEYTNRLIEYEDFDASYEINRFDFYPTLALSRQFKNDQQMMTSYSRRVDRPRSYFLDSIPSFIDKNTIRIGNPGLEPEYINSLEAGYQKGWGKNFMALEAYYRQTQNMITRVTEYVEAEDIFYQRFQNINQEHVAGGEVMVNWEFAKWFKMNVGTNVYYNRIEGELFGQEVNNSNVTWSGNASTTFTVTPLSRIQANFGYRGPSVTAQGSAEGMFFTSVAVRQDFFKRKLSATLQVRDLFGTMRREFTANGEGFSQYVYMQREPQMVMLSLSYKINNYRMRPEDMRQGSGGGVEMDAGF